ncbi:MAG: response regulator [Thermoanaerobaculia bacterium]
MLVDPNRNVLWTANRVIGSMGISLILSDDPNTALVLARLFRPELVITEAVLSKIDGRELCRAMKGDPLLTGTKVIVMSDVYRGDRYAKEAIEEFGADEFLEKPVSSFSLRRSIDHFATLPRLAGVM